MITYTIRWQPVPGQDATVEVNFHSVADGDLGHVAAQQVHAALDDAGLRPATTATREEAMQW